MPTNNNKISRVQAIISRNLSEIIQYKLKDPRLPMVFINEVRVSKDISYAKVYVSFFDKNHLDERMDILNHSKGFIRTELSKCMDTRRIPELTFVYDDTYDRVEHLEEILKK